MGAYALTFEWGAFPWSQALISNSRFQKPPLVQASSKLYEWICMLISMLAELNRNHCVLGPAAKQV